MRRLDERYIETIGRFIDLHANLRVDFGIPLNDAIALLDAVRDAYHALDYVETVLLTDEIDAKLKIERIAALLRKESAVA